MKWLYFSLNKDVYRMPDNGKKMIEQEADDVQVYEPDGTWTGPRKALLFGEAMSGWFSEKQDRITEAQALEIMAKVSAKAQESGNK
jgi:hypothetical protein